MACWPIILHRLKKPLMNTRLALFNTKCLVGKTLQETGVFAIKNVGEFCLNADRNLIFTPYDQTNYLSSSFGLSPFVSPLVKRAVFEQQLESLEETGTIQLVPEHKNKYSLLKYAAVFVLGLGLTATVGYPIYQNEIETQKIIVETAVQRQVQNKIQEATFSSKVQFLP